MWIPSRGSQARGSTLFQYLLCSFATSQTVSVPSSLATRGGNWSGASPNKTLVTASADTEIESKLYPPWCPWHVNDHPGNTRCELTSKTTTMRPFARPANMWVIWAYPAGVTRHSPSSSPAAASNPADTVIKGSY